MSNQAPYQGIAGVRAAYERFKYWIGVDLPREWDELNALLGLLGQQASPPAIPPPPAPPPPSPPPPPTPSTVPFSDYPQSAYARSALDAVGQAQYDSFYNEATIAPNFAYGPTLGVPFDGSPNPGIDAIIALGWTVVHQPPPPDTSGPVITEGTQSSLTERNFAVRAAPPAVASSLYPGWDQWVYGTAVNWT